MAPQFPFRVFSGSRSLYQRIATAFLLLTAAIALVLSLVLYRGWKEYSTFLEQILNWDLAVNALPRFSPYLHPALQSDKLDQELYEVTSTNPRVEVFVLDSAGEVIVARARGAVGTKVDLAPIQQFLMAPGPAAEPIYGTNPHEPAGRPVVFSVARAPVQGGIGYLYITLLAQRYLTIRDSIADVGSFRTSFVALVCSLLFASALGLVVFYFITRRFYTMTAVLKRFKDGDYSQRIPDASNDEIGIHARTFNQMADTIVANIEALKRADALRRELVASVTHDLRRPLARVQALLDTLTLKNAEFSSEERQELLRRAVRGCEGLNDLINDLFELAKLEARETVPEARSVSVHDLVDDLQLKFEHLAEKRGVVLVIEAAPGLPPIAADPRLLDRALSNLIENAIYYTPANGRVVVRLAASDAGVEITIEDTGIGIPEEDLPRVFDRFYRSRNSSDKEPEGTGLGLPIAKRIVEAHGSELLLRSRLHEGTSFSFTLKSAAPPGASH